MIPCASLALVCLLVLQVAYVTPADASPADGEGRQRGEAIATEIRMRVTLRYLVYTPPNYDASKHDWPLVLFLHGSGERGTELSRIKIHGLPKLAAQGQDFPFLIVSPLCPPNDTWSSPLQMAALVRLLDELPNLYRIDQDRVYLTGLSLGGYGTWNLAAYAPDRFAAIVPVSGGGNPLYAERIRHIPVWAFHGETDGAVPAEKSREMIERLKAINAVDARLTLYPEVGHNCWDTVYGDPAMLEWMLSHKRKAP